MTPERWAEFMEETFGQTGIAMIMAAGFGDWLGPERWAELIVETPTFNEAFGDA